MLLLLWCLKNQNSYFKERTPQKPGITTTEISGTNRDPEFQDPKNHIMLIMIAGKHIGFSIFQSLMHRTG